VVLLVPHERNEILPQERIWATQEQLCGFLLSEVINPKGEFYFDRKSVGKLNPIRTTLTPLGESMLVTLVS
jgi:hypothetical protein